MRTSLSVASSLKRPRSHDTTTKPIMTSWRGLRRLLGDMGRLFLLGLVISAMALMLPNRPPQEPPPGGAYAGDESRVGGMPVYSKVLHIWLSERLADVAKREPLARLVQGHQDPDVALTRRKIRASSTRLPSENIASTARRPTSDSFAPHTSIVSTFKSSLVSWQRRAGFLHAIPRWTFPGPRCTLCRRPCRGARFWISSRRPPIRWLLFHLDRGHPREREPLSQARHQVGRAQRRCKSLPDGWRRIRNDRPGPGPDVGGLTDGGAGTGRPARLWRRVENRGQDDLDAPSPP